MKFHPTLFPQVWCVYTDVQVSWAVKRDYRDIVVTIVAILLWVLLCLTKYKLWHGKNGNEYIDR